MPATCQHASGCAEGGIQWRQKHMNVCCNSTSVSSPSAQPMRKRGRMPLCQPAGRGATRPATDARPTAWCHRSPFSDAHLRLRAADNMPPIPPPSCHNRTATSRQPTHPSLQPPPGWGPPPPAAPQPDERAQTAGRRSGWRLRTGATSAAPAQAAVHW